MQHLIVAPASSPNSAVPERRLPRIGLGRAITVLLLMAVLSTAGFVHLIWQRAANHNTEKVVASLDAQSASAVRASLTTTLSAAEATAETVRSIVFQGAISAGDEVKREYLFLSLLRTQPALGWIGFGFPDGRFFGAHAAAPDRIEMVEIGAAPPGAPRPLRRDLYHPIPGDVMFDRRILGQSAYVPLGAPWYREAKDSSETVWSVAGILPAGFEPSVVVSKRIELYGKYQGVVMVAVNLTTIAETLRALNMAGHGKGFVLDRGGMVLSTSDSGDRVMAAHLADFPASDVLAGAVAGAVKTEGGGEFRTLVDARQVGPVFVSSAMLPFEDWRLLTAIPRSAFTEEIDRNARRVLYVVGALALLAAATAVVFANLLFARPIARLSAQLRHVERFSLDGVRYAPTFLSELNDFSLALKHMAGGLSAFAKYMPLDVVQPLISGGVEPRPGGHLREVTVMFADLPGFTELTETLGPGVEPHLTSFLTIAVAAVHAEGGTVDKFIGDAVMAIWNAPSAVPDHALRACRAAAAIRTAMHALPAISPDRDAIRVRIGINTGTALVGNVGSAERLSYTAIGDTVNLASRLVGTAKEHYVEIVLSEMTLEQTAGRLATRPLGIAMVRGKTIAVPIHTLAT